MLDLRTLITTAGITVFAAAGAAQGAAPRKLTVHLHTKPPVFIRGGKVLAKPPAKPKLGDLITQVATILRNGKRIGHEDVLCGLMAANREICTVVDRLPGGTIVHIGEGDPMKPTFVDAIVGGTGKYVGATGSAVATFTGPLDATQVYTFGS